MTHKACELKMVFINAMNSYCMEISTIKYPQLLKVLILKREYSICETSYYQHGD